jgi:hypothetical protein
MSFPTTAGSTARFRSCIEAIRWCWCRRAWVYQVLAASEGRDALDQHLGDLLTDKPAALHDAFSKG